MFPPDNRYAPTHEWVRLEGDLAVIGITAYAAQQLSDITYIELPSVGEDLAAESVFATVESVKTAADLTCPIDGEVVEANDAIVENPEPIGTDPYDDGWLIKVRPADVSQMEHLMTAEEYQVLLQADEDEEEASTADDEDTDEERDETE